MWKVTGAIWEKLVVTVERGIYQQSRQPERLRLPNRNCVARSDQALASIGKAVWSRKALDSQDYGSRAPRVEWLQIEDTTSLISLESRSSRSVLEDFSFWVRAWGNNQSWSWRDLCCLSLTCGLMVLPKQSLVQWFLPPLILLLFFFTDVILLRIPLNPGTSSWDCLYSEDHKPTLFWGILLQLGSLQAIATNSSHSHAMWPYFR